MGAFKPLLPFGDRTVIECCIKNLRDADIGEIVVVLGHRAEELRRHLQDAKVSFVVNPNPDSEMSVSIAHGIERVNEDALAVIIGLVDHPAVSPETIGILIQEWKAGAKLVQPEHNGRGGHPVLVDLDYRAQLLNLDPKQGLRAFFEAHRTEVRRVPVESPFVARNMNTWDDYCALHQAVFGRKPEKIGTRNRL
jgi:CTP:molybdopterin cytidylyltransferase MocA